MRYLGIDFGTSKVGLALSDEAGKMGFPHSVITNNADLLKSISALITKEGIGAIVFGESLDLSGNGNPVLAKAHAFANDLAQEHALPIFWEPEMFTTQVARRGMDGTHPQHTANTARQRDEERGHSKAIDASAAALILTSYLSHHE